MQEPLQFRKSSGTGPMAKVVLLSRSSVSSATTASASTIFRGDFNVESELNGVSSRARGRLRLGVKILHRGVVENQSESHHIEEGDPEHELLGQILRSYGSQNHLPITAYPASLCAHVKQMVRNPACITFAPSTEAVL